MSNSLYQTRFDGLRSWAFNHLYGWSLTFLLVLSFYLDYATCPSMRRCWRYAKDCNDLYHDGYSRRELWYRFCDKPHQLSGMRYWSWR